MGRSRPRVGGYQARTEPDIRARIEAEGRRLSDGLRSEAKLRKPHSKGVGRGDLREPVRITRDIRVMGGKPCIRGMRVTVGTVVGLVAAGHTTEMILREYPHLEAADVAEALSYAAWRA